MRRWVRWAAALYPARWRERYGAEFEALLEDAHPRWTDFFDTLWGALKMQMADTKIWKTAVLVGALGAVVAAGIAWRMPERYVSSAILRPSDAGAANLDMGFLSQRTFTRDGLTQIIVKNGLYAPERSRVPMEDVVERMRRDILIARMSSRAGGELFRVQLANPNAAVARTAAKDLVADLIAAQESIRHESARLTPGEPAPAALEVLDPPNLPERPISPNRPMVIAIGLLAGALVGVVAGFLRRRPARWTARVAAFGAAGAVAAAALSFLIPDRFVSNAVLRIAAGQDQALREINQKTALFPGEAEAAAKMRANLRIVAHASSGKNWTAVALQYSDHDRFKAQSVLGQLLAQVMAPSQATPSRLEVLDPPSLPGLPVFPNRRTIAAIGLAIGLASGVFWQRKAAVA